jgi:hypothetical protein
VAIGGSCALDEGFQYRAQFALLGADLPYGALVRDYHPHPFLNQCFDGSDLAVVLGYLSDQVLVFGGHWFFSGSSMVVSCFHENIKMCSSFVEFNLIREFGEFSHGPSEKFLLLIQADFLGILEGA